ncbi:phosphotransferase family protein [Noviherbaspirillum sp.]|uniref:phosphotransferase family protein n=1 Tax=Noviherbaspirillum sp. TaxID=1926288 RepID=UPI0025CE1B23|nr:phosphotransferase family protein [Noviherbaspirillum sp.]
MFDEENSGTRAVAPQHQFDVERLETFLSKSLSGFAGPVSVQQFKGGQSNPTYKLSTPNHHYVMRAKPGPAASLLPSAHAIEREYRVLKALHGSDVPVAAPLLLCEDEAVIGRAFYLMEMMDGRVLWDPAMPGASADERSRLYDEMNRVIAALHKIDYAAVGLADYGKPGNYFARQTDRWTKQYRGAETEVIEAMDNLIAWLPRNMPVDDGLASIVHGDFRVDNLIFHATQPRALAVLDWELSTLGHPLADFAYHCMAWRAPRAFRGLAGESLAALGIPDERAYVEKYCDRTGFRVTGNWNFYLAFNLFRLAGINQGVAKRALDGTASSEQAQRVGKTTRPLAEMAWSYAQRTEKNLA